MPRSRRRVKAEGLMKVGPGSTTIRWNLCAWRTIMRATVMSPERRTGPWVLAKSFRSSRNPPARGWRRASTAQAFGHRGTDPGVIGQAAGLEFPGSDPCGFDAQPTVDDLFDGEALDRARRAAGAGVIFHGLEFVDHPLGIVQPAEVMEVALDLHAPLARALVGRQGEVGVRLLDLALHLLDLALFANQSRYSASAPAGSSQRPKYFMLP